MTGHYADCDPILHATYLDCPACHSQSYPVDAQWVSERLILVTYEPCPGHCPNRRRPATVLVDVDADSTTVPAAPRPRMCQGTVRAGSRKGQPCRSPAGKASPYCVQHDPSRRPA